MSSELSNETIYQAISEITPQFTIFQCAECAEAIKKWLKIHYISGLHLKLKVLGRSNFIVSHRWDGGYNSITQNGTHYGIKVRGKVFDNLSSFGLSEEDWLADFSCSSGQFTIEIIEKF